MAKRVNPAAIQHGATRTWEAPESDASAFASGIIEGPGEFIRGLLSLVQSLPAMASQAAEYVSPGGPNLINHRAVGRAARDLRGKWDGMSDQEKRQVVEMVGEATGGTAGAIAGGPTPWAIPLSAAGGVLGKIVSADLATLGGLDDDRSSAEFARELGKALSVGALAEGGGRLAPALAGKAGRAANPRRLFTVHPERQAAVDAADQAGIELGVAERSGRALPELSSALLSYLPSSIKVMHKGGERMIRQYEKALGNLGKKIHPSAVTPGDVARVAKKALEGKRTSLNRQVESAIPERVSPREAGEGYQAARGAALEDLRRLGSELYDPIMREYGSTPIDMTDAGRRASEILGNEVEGAVEALYPRNAVEQLRSIGALKPKTVTRYPEGRPASDFPGVEQYPWLKESYGITSETITPTMTLQQLRELRTSLLERARRQAPNAPSLDRRTVHELIDTLNEAVDTSDLPPDVIEKLSAANKAYSTEARRLFPPESKTGEGNLMARIGEGVEPERIPGRIVTPGASKKVEDALEAATPRSGPTADLGTFKTGSLHEQFIDPARVETGPGQSRISPGKLAGQRRKIGPDAERSLFGTEGPSRLEYLSNDDLVRLENEAYNTPTSRSIESFEKPPRTLLHELAPEGHPERFQYSKEFLGDQGDILSRGFFDDMVESSRHHDRTIGMDPVTDPIRLAESARKAGGSMDVALGGAKEEFDRLANVGKVTKKIQDEFGNPSGTARMGLLEKARGKIFQAAQNPIVHGAGAISTLGIPYYLSKKFTDPKFARSITRPIESAPIAPFASAPLTTTAARVAGVSGRENDQSPKIDWEQFRRVAPQPQEVDWEQFRRVQ